MDTGEKLWEFETDDKAVSSPVATEDGVYVGSLDEHLYAVDRDTGEELWNFEANGPVASSPAYKDGVLYVGSSDSTLYAVNSNSGDAIWRCEVDGPVVSSPLVSGDVVYVGSNDSNIYSIRNVVGDGDAEGAESREIKAESQYRLLNPVEVTRQDFSSSATSCLVCRTNPSTTSTTRSLTWVTISR